MFRFRLQQVLDLRQKEERDLATQLAAAVGAERSAKEVLDGLLAERETGAEGVQSQCSHSVGELANVAFLMQQLDGQIESASETVNAASDGVVQAKAALTEAFKDRRVLDRLRDRHEETYRVTAAQTDRRTMDDIALSRFVHHDNDQ